MQYGFSILDSSTELQSLIKDIMLKKENGNETYHGYSNCYKVAGTTQEGKLLFKWKKRMMSRKTINGEK